ncbi:conserved domain protein [Bacteroides clarus YIT 12056]|uniref:Conserved domain protein n=1 Tax=Bacteroides clarus YIT 12056 TaxID=762984 RepID=A0ABN0CPD3_9BACE|nr:conserved domain protein [Bacteroides clarus YIT 12056]
MERYSSAHAADSTAGATSGLSGTPVAGLLPKNRKQGKNRNKKDKQTRNINIRPEKISAAKLALSVHTPITQIVKKRGIIR